ncbi:hypothetical protein L1887_18362 [Cichorium endivia]|nr:hypothetical protein L1887_18362 [Cichorium endivia]
MAVELPSELIVQILSWLPSKSLLQCRSVCESWLSLISSTQFSHMHLQNFNQLNSRYLVRRRFIQKEEFAVHFDDHNFTLDTSSPIKFPYNFNLSGTGLLSFEIIGLSHDCLLESIITKSQAQIYTVKTAIWREVVFPNDLPSFVFVNHSVFLNGFVHWVAYYWTSSDCSILTFDMSKELFGEIKLPKSFDYQDIWGQRLAVVGDSLAIIDNFNTLSCSCSYKIWVLKDYNNPISLTMRYTVEFYDYVARALGLTNNGDLIMVGYNEGDVMICKREGYCCSVYGSCSEGIDSHYTFVERYQESLVLLDHGELDVEA